MNSIKENPNLIEIPPGKYVRAGSDGEGFKEIVEPTQGLVVDHHLTKDKKFRTVLVDGDLINWWVEKSSA